MCRGSRVCVWALRCGQGPPGVCRGPQAYTWALRCVQGPSGVFALALRYSSGSSGMHVGPRVCSGPGRCAAAVPSISTSECPSSVLREQGWWRITCFHNCSRKQGLCRSGWCWQNTDTRGDTRGPSLNTWETKRDRFPSPGSWWLLFCFFYYVS